jgi:DNA-binding IclR family transcriptional regulator
MSNVQSVERAFAILTVVAANPEGVGVTKIAHQVDLPKSTVSRLLATLENLEAVERAPNTDGFRIGPGTIALASGLPYAQHLLTLTRPYLNELTQATSEAVSLCLPDQDRAYVVAQFQSQHHVQVRDWTGDRLPLHAASAGQIFLAYWPEDLLERYLMQPLEPLTSKTITGPDQLRQRLATSREQGYTWAYEEYASGVSGVAAPIRVGIGQVVAVVNVFGPISRFPPEGQEDEIARLVVETGHKIAERIRKN